MENRKNIGLKKKNEVQSKKIIIVDEAHLYFSNLKYPNTKTTKIKQQK